MASYVTLAMSPKQIELALRQEMPWHERRRLERYLAWVEFWHRFGPFPG